MGCDKVSGLVRGQIDVYRLHYVHGNRSPQPSHLFGKANQIQYSWGFLAAKLLGDGDPAYRIRAMYIEYENLADPDDPVTPPTFDRTEGTEYYNNLALSGSRDFLRVPLSVRPTLGIAAGYEDYFVDGVTGNKLTFVGQTQGSAGVHGKPCNSGVNSKVFGIALVGTPVFADATQDVVFARTYFDTGDQVLVQSSSHIGIMWSIVFG